MEEIELQKYAAGKYLSQGLSIIPLMHKGKIPAADALRISGDINRRGKITWKKFWDYQAPPETIQAWFSETQRNIGIVSGYQSLVVVDFDISEAYMEWSEKYQHIAKSTATQRTQKGYHVLLKLPKLQNSLKGLITYHFRLEDSKWEVAGQVQGKRCYIAAWPSFHPKGSQYTWLAGQAPWESGIASVSSLKEVGIFPANPSLFIYGSFLLRWFIDPLHNIEVVRHRIMRFLGQWHSENYHLRPKYYYIGFKKHQQEAGDKGRLA